MVYRRDYSRQWPLNPFAPAKQAILCTELKKVGFWQRICKLLCGKCFTLLDAYCYDLM